MRLVSWNVNGLRAVVGKNFAEAFETLNADVFALQETKLQEGQIDLCFPGYRSFWSYAEKKGYSGTAVFTREAPLQVLHGLGFPHLDNEGRIVACEFEDFWFVDVYTPNAQNGLARIDHRLEWDAAFRDFCKGLEEGVLPAGVPVERPVADGSAPQDASTPAAAEGYTMGVTQAGETAAPKPVVMCGDFNVAHNEIDLKNPKSNEGNAGFSMEERESFTKLLDAGFTDTWRTQHPDTAGVYSWWSYRFKARANNAGWRIDYFLVSNALMDKVTHTDIYCEVMGSDHCPVGLEL